VLHNSDFAENASLQNLLILTAIKSYPTRVMDYINKLDQYDGMKLAELAKDPEYGLYDEALCIYKKINQPVEAIRVIIYNLNNIKQATEYAEKVNQPAVFSELGKAQLDHQDLAAALEAFIRAADPSMFERVILLNESLMEKQDLVQYLLMARKTLKDRKVDNELIYAYAKGGEKYLSVLESFVSDPNQADMLACGERCFNERMFLAAEILFKRIGNNQLLAKTYVMLKKFQQAYEAARKADIPKVWKAVCFACIRAKEFVMANKCGQHVIIHPDHLEDVIQFYERFGYCDELI
jgi:clathrin heavy chain